MCIFFLETSFEQKTKMNYDHISQKRKVPVKAKTTWYMTPYGLEESKPINLHVGVILLGLTLKRKKGNFLLEIYAINLKYYD